MIKNATIYVEGLDLAGKSTVCRLLHDKLGAEMRSKSLITDNLLCQQARMYRQTDILNSEVIGWFYYGALAADLLRYRRPEQLVIQDSTILVRSLALHRVMQHHRLADHFEAMLELHPRFEVAVVLTASQEVRLKRFEGRIGRGNDSRGDYLIRTDPELFWKIESLIQTIMTTHFNAVVIDSSTLEQDGEKDRITDQIISLLPR